MGRFDLAKVPSVCNSVCRFADLSRSQMCITRLEKRFPGSPRVAPLHGMFLEARGDFAAAKELYEKELEKPVDPKAQGATGEANVVSQTVIQLLKKTGHSRDRCMAQRIRKRLISLHLQHPSSDMWVEHPPHSAPVCLTWRGLAHSGLSVPKGIELLVQHLDTVYSDPEGWLELAEAYSQLGLSVAASLQPAA